MTLPECVESNLIDDCYKCDRKDAVLATLDKLQITPSNTFIEFYAKNCGAFGSPKLGYELLDIIEPFDYCIEAATLSLRQNHGFPKNFLALTELYGGAILILDAASDDVYEVDFEGGDQLLFQGNLKPNWNSFFDFLEEYFCQSNEYYD